MGGLLVVYIPYRTCTVYIKLISNNLADNDDVNRYITLCLISSLANNTSINSQYGRKYNCAELHSYSHQIQSDTVS